MESTIVSDQTATALPPPPSRTRKLPALPLHVVEPVVIPLMALVSAFIVFGIFIALAGANPFESMQLMYKGAFGSAFSVQNTLVRAAPLMLTGLCTAIPLRLGMVIIGGEGALVLGALTAAGVSHLLPDGMSTGLAIFLMAISGCFVGGLWITLAGALKYYRGVNETISSLLLNYIAIALLNQAVEGWMHDPESLNTPSTWAVPDLHMIPKIMDSDVHWGLVWGVIICVAAWVLMNHTVIGFASRIAGGNIRAARVAGLSVGRLTILFSMLAGAAAGLAGVVEVAAIQGRANANIYAPQYGYTGILVAFIARGNPLAVIPVAILMGGIGASGGLLQRRQHLPDATVLVFQGIIFLMILAFETFYGRFKIFQRKDA